MTPETSPSPRRRWHLGWWLLGFALAACAWVGWREYDYRAAVRTAKAAGWWESRDPIQLILQDWRVAGKRTTRTDRYRRVTLPVGTELATAGPLLSRLQPTSLVALRCPDTHLESIRGLTALERLDLSASSRLQIMPSNNIALLPYSRGISRFTRAHRIMWAAPPYDPWLHNYNWHMPWTGMRTIITLRGLPIPNDFNLYSTGLQNVDALRGLPALRILDLHGCVGLQNVHGLHGHPALTALDLSDCTGLQNVDGLRGLPALATLDLSGCTGLQNVDGLRDLPALQRLNLSGCTGLSAPALRELRVALPEARIAFPDGTLDPPQPKREVWLWGVSVVLPTDEDGGE